MAKKPRKAKLSISAPSQPKLASAVEKEEKDWKTRDDADRIRRYAELRTDKERHKSALDHLRNEHQTMGSILRETSEDNYAADEGPNQPRMVARAGRKKSTRVPRTGSRR